MTPILELSWFRRALLLPRPLSHRQTFHVFEYILPGRSPAPCEAWRRLQRPPDMQRTARSPSQMLCLWVRRLSLPACLWRGKLPGVLQRSGRGHRLADGGSGRGQSLDRQLGASPRRLIAELYRPRHRDKLIRGQERPDNRQARARCFTFC
ncbi:hypothetical protein D187_008273 [Cystobacter fuscus DSM 2262]|uniref:Uncharacterized protein n=1 Tax=Cystobacter fuscus (strain ATCC 25194 / DSM 2262 / NBRC 100088 / M29) TaxID=1242864 RepID=S9P0D1_CYSF2|nr:hypothetical protein D187_008273 [Cystobacter fuscus DSM 2262]